MNIKLIDYRPPRIAQLLLVLAAACHLLLPVLDFHVYRNTVLAVILGVAGFGIMMQAWWLFKKFETAICPSAVESRLVTTGVFRFTRNPMYLGMIMMLLAVALGVGSLTFYLVTAVYFLIIHCAFCPYEERKLEEVFGDAYAKYRKSVRRWF